jgi:hypothetical protein
MWAVIPVASGFSRTRDPRGVRLQPDPEPGGI